MTTIKSGRVKEWHNPRNDECPHNQELASDCTCKRIVNRKPYRKVRVYDEKVPHGYRPNIVVEVWPNGLIRLREMGRRDKNAHGIFASDLLPMLVRRRALAELAAKKKARAERRKQKRGGK